MASRKNSRKRITFEVEASPDSEVFVAGSFNDWDPGKKKLRFKKSAGIHSITMLLDRGKQFEYKYVVDGDWCVDPNNDEVVSNGLGSMNSVLRT